MALLRRRACTPAGPLAPAEVLGAPNPDGTYNIDRLVGATKRGNRWYIEIKWEGYTETTEETRTWLRSNCTDPEILSEMERLIAHAQHPSFLDDSYGELEASDDSSDS